jgi:hypothetical protein
MELEFLEHRLTPAFFFYNQSFGNLSIQLDTGQDLTVAEAGGTRTFTLSNGRWQFSGVDRPTSVDGDSLTFDASKNLGGLLAIAGGPFTNNVTFAGGTLNANQVIVNLGTGPSSEGTISFTTVRTSFTGVVALNFLARGNILQTAPITATAPSSFATNASLINLNNPENDFIDPVSVANQGNVAVSLSDANNLTLLAVNMETGSLTVQAAGQVNFAGPWAFRLNQGGPSFQVVVAPGATGVSLNGVALTGSAAGYVLNDQVVLVQNQAAVALAGGFTNGASATLGDLEFSVGINVGEGNNDVVLTSIGTRNEIYVSNLYLVLLERPVDPIGLASYSQELDHGASRQQVVASIMSSSEYLTLQVTTLYQTLLGRQPDQSGLTSHVAFLQQGGTIRDLKSQFFGSEEYFQVRGNGTNDGWLTAVYQDVLGRDVDPSGGAAWTMQLAQGVSRQAIATSIQLSPEATTRLVEGFYLQYLGRPADPIGLQAFASDLSAGASEEFVISSMVTSDEFYKRPLILTA